MADLLAKQQQLMHSIDRALDNFKKIDTRNYTPAKVRSRITALKNLWMQFQDGHAGQGYSRS